MIDEMRSTVADFLQHSTNTLSKMKAKYKKELLKRTKLWPKGKDELKSATTLSSAFNSRDNDDISVMSLEGDCNNSSKC